MNRRELLVLAGSTTALARAALAQQTPMPVIGFFSSTSPEAYASRLAAFRQGLNDVGYVEGRDVTIEYRWAEGRYDRLPALAAELVGRKVDVIVATASPAALAAKSATPTIPIVFVAVADPVAVRLAASLARPGGNITGFSAMSIELMSKRLELL
jgi:putative ABC transport system substrate-binding protein